MSSGSESMFFPRKSTSTLHLEENGERNLRRCLSDPSWNLKDILLDVTKFSIADLIASILRLDFWDPKNTDSIEFCKTTLEIFLKSLALPPGTNNSIRHHLQGDGASDDIASFVTIIKKDKYLLANGMVELLISILLILVTDGKYDCRYRVLLRHLCALLGADWDNFENAEDALADFLMEIKSNYAETEASKCAREKTSRSKKIKRYVLIGVASGVGGILVGLTGGLAAPLVATGAGVIIGAGAASGIATNVGIAVLASIFGATGAGLAGYKMNKRVGAIDEFVIESLTEGSSLHCVLTVSGWIEDDSKNAFRKQWRHLWMSREQFTLRYESKYLIELGKAIEYLMSFAVSVAIQQTLMETALAGLMSAIAWPIAVLSAANVLDNPWNVCVSRAAEVGDFLAEILLRRAHGKYPITLIGFSLGARVIYHCLLTMSQRADYAGIIEDVVLLGAPVSASSRQWHQMCRVVGGRIINGYSTSDWLLRFLYRTMNIQFAIAGIGPIDSQKNRKIVNFNLSHLINGHLDYSRKLTEVLKAVGIKVTPHRENSSFNLSQVAKEVDLEEAINRSNIITDAKIKNTVEFDVNLYSDSDRIV